MHARNEGCEVVLVRERRVVTRFQIDLPAGMLVDQIVSGQRRFRRFGRGQSLAAVRLGERVVVWTGDERPDIARISCGTKADPADRIARKPAGLTDRQRQVLAGLAEGQTLAEIGFQLGIRVRSVRHHVDALKRKLGAVSLSELVARAAMRGLPLSTPPQGGAGAGRRSDHPKKH
jgi:DNA-binding CsgD family transcriptional regulator